MCVHVCVVFCKRTNEWNISSKLSRFCLNSCWYDGEKQTNKQLNLNKCFYSWDKMGKYVSINNLAVGGHDLSLFFLLYSRHYNFFQYEFHWNRNWGFFIHFSSSLSRMFFLPTGNWLKFQRAFYATVHNDSIDGT